jgi:glutathione S-transferase
LQLDDGRVLTEGPAVVQYLADQKPDLGLAPRAVSLSPRRRHRCPAARTAATQAAHTTDSGP